MIASRRYGDQQPSHLSSQASSAATTPDQLGAAGSSSQDTPRGLQATSRIDCNTLSRRLGLLYNPSDRDCCFYSGERDLSMAPVSGKAYSPDAGPLRCLDEWDCCSVLGARTAVVFSRRAGPLHCPCERDSYSDPGERDCGVLPESRTVQASGRSTSPASRPALTYPGEGESNGTPAKGGTQR